MQVFIYKNFPKKILCGNLYMANIVWFYSFLIQVEIKKIITEVVVKVRLTDIDNRSSQIQTNVITH